jgi:hypothetical protein
MATRSQIRVPGPDADRNVTVGARSIGARRGLREVSCVDEQVDCISQRGQERRVCVVDRKGRMTGTRQTGLAWLLSQTRLWPNALRRFVHQLWAACGY